MAGEAGSFNGRTSAFGAENLGSIPRPASMNPCGKFWHKTEEEATQHLAVMLKQPSIRKGYLLDAYYCEDCEGWHIGHSHYKGIKQLCIGEHK